ncbi:MAG: hypothetical protein MK116_11715 [Phycisphaerales bacterium]|nr:hypothetical protein [Phycisphaerales bacterium]
MSTLRTLCLLTAATLITGAVASGLQPAALGGIVVGSPADNVISPPSQGGGWPGEAFVSPPDLPLDPDLWPLPRVAEMNAVIDAGDLAHLMANYGHPESDVNGDGVGDINDLARLLDGMGRPRLELYRSIPAEARAAN